MLEMNNDDYETKLRRRRNEMVRTLDHVRNEQSAVEKNKEWIDRAAYESRCYLLDSLAQWYIKKMIASMRLSCVSPKAHTAYVGVAANL